MSLYGLEECSRLIGEETQKAIGSLSCFNDADFLMDLARQMAVRDF